MTLNSSKISSLRADCNKLLLNYVESGALYGHSLKKLNPKMVPYIYTEQMGTCILDPLKAVKLLQAAGQIVQKHAEFGGKFLFVGTHSFSATLISEAAKRTSSSYVNSRWLGGTLTNWGIIKNQILYLQNLEKNTRNCSSIISEKEYHLNIKKKQKLHWLFDGLKDISRLPDLVIFIHQLKDLVAINECLALGIPTVCIVDTDCNPDLVLFPIPGNDNSLLSISYILNYLVNKIQDGAHKYNKN